MESFRRADGDFREAALFPHSLVLMTAKTPQSENSMAIRGRPAVPKPPRALAAGTLMNRKLLCLAAAVCLSLAACGGEKRVKLPPPLPAKVGWTQRGIASWYGHPYHGRLTSNGERYDMNQISAAHKRLPFDTWVLVTNLDNKKTLEVRINDRGPFIKGRIIDLSRAAAKKIDMLGSGTARVRIKVVAKPGKRRRARPAARRSAPVKSAAGPCRSKVYFGVQIGAFAALENAESLRDRIAERYAGLGPSRIVSSRLSAGTRHRVVIGRFSGRDAASKLRRRLRKAGMDGFVIEFNGPAPPGCRR